MANRCARGVSWLRPSAPYACIARSTTRRAIEGTTNCNGMGQSSYSRLEPRRLDLSNADLFEGTFGLDLVNLRGRQRCSATEGLSGYAHLEGCTQNEQSRRLNLCA